MPNVKLSDSDRHMLEGLEGEGVRMAMSIIVRMADALDVEQLQDITGSHIDGCGLLSDAGIEFAVKLADAGAKVRVPTTLNMGPLDLQHWRRFNIDPDWAARAERQSEAYERMGCVPTWTCAPYQGYLTPRLGQQIAWGESNAVCYANSVLGARTNRYADYLDICAAITGRVPSCGLHLAENRRGEFLVRIGEDVPPEYWSTSDAAWAAFGHWLGPIAREKVPVIEGLPKNATSDQLKALCAASASSGSIALFHAVGLTPEAPTRDAAFAENSPEREVTVSLADLEEAWADLSTAKDGDPIEAVVLGCPHLSYDEFRRVAAAIESVDAQKHADVRFIVLTSQQSLALAARSGYPEIIEQFGGEITLDTCVFHTPIASESTKTIMTNSGKCAYYAPGDLNVHVAFGTIEACVRSAVKGSAVLER